MTRIVHLVDPLARANVVEALRGAGGPVGVLGVEEDGATLRVLFDDAITGADLIDDLIAIESLFVPDRTLRPLAADDVAAIAAAGLGDPELDASRVLEGQHEAARR